MNQKYIFNLSTILKVLVTKNFHSLLFLGLCTSLLQAQVTETFSSSEKITTTEKSTVTQQSNSTQNSTKQSAAPISYKAITTTIHFQPNSDTVSHYYYKNYKQVKLLDSVLNNKKTMPYISVVKIIGTGSPYESEKFVNRITTKRVLNIQKYILKFAPNVDTSLFSKRIKREDWQQLAAMIELDRNVPDKLELLKIISSPKLNSEQKRENIKNLKKGKPLAYIKKQILPHLRNAKITIIYADKPRIRLDTSTIKTPKDTIKKIIQDTIKKAHQDTIKQPAKKEQTPLPKIPQAIEKAFTIQLYTGYTYMMGEKIGIYTGNYGLGSFNSGQIPIGIEFKYKLINEMLWNKNYRAAMKRMSNTFTDNLYFNFAYAGHVGIPYTYHLIGTNFEDTYVFNLTTHVFRLGAMYDFTPIFYKNEKNANNLKHFRTYVGLDLALLLSKRTNNYTENVQGVDEGTTKFSSQWFANFGVMPKVEVEYYLPKNCFGNDTFSQWWYNNNFHFVGAVHYMLIVPSKIKNADPIADSHQQNFLNHSLNVKFGIGFKF